MTFSSQPKRGCSSLNEAIIDEKNKGVVCFICNITLSSPKHLDTANIQIHRRRYLEWAAKQKDPVPIAFGVTIPNGGADGTPSSVVTIRRSKRIRKAVVQMRCSAAVRNSVKVNSNGVKCSTTIGRNRNRSTVRFEEHAVIWTREVEDPKKLCGNVLQIPVPVIKKCYHRRISRIVLRDSEKRMPYYCEVIKRPKKMEKYCIGGWSEFGKDRMLEVGDKVHFCVRYERVDQIEVSVVRGRGSGQQA